MKDLLTGLLRTLAQIAFSIVAPLVLIVLGALIAGFGLYKEWEWMTSGGIIVAALGALFLFRYFSLDD